MEKSRQLLEEFPCVTAILSKISNEIVFIDISKDHETESFEATLRVKATDVSGEDYEGKCQTLRHSFEQATNTGLIVDKTLRAM